MSTDNRYKILLKTHDGAIDVPVGFRTLDEIDLVLEKYNEYQNGAEWPLIDLIDVDEGEIRGIIFVASNDVLAAYNCLKLMRRLVRNPKSLTKTQQVRRRRTKQQIILDTLYPNGVPAPPQPVFVDTSIAIDDRPCIELRHTNSRHTIYFSSTKTLNQGIDLLYGWWYKHYKSELDYRRLSSTCVVLEIKDHRVYSEVYHYLDSIKL